MLLIEAFQRQPHSMWLHLGPHNRTPRRNHVFVAGNYIKHDSTIQHQRQLAKTPTSDTSRLAVVAQHQAPVGTEPISRRNQHHYRNQRQDHLGQSLQSTTAWKPHNNQSIVAPFWNDGGSSGPRTWLESLGLWHSTSQLKSSLNFVHPDAAVLEHVVKIAGSLFLLDKQRKHGLNRKCMRMEANRSTLLASFGQSDHIVISLQHHHHYLHQEIMLYRICTV